MIQGSNLLKQGSKGSAVAKVQNVLNAVPPPGIALKEDGIFGALTDKRVRMVQKALGLPVDGVVGPETLTALGVSLDAYTKLSEQIERIFRQGQVCDAAVLKDFKSRSAIYGRSMVPIAAAPAAVLIIAGAVFILFCIALLAILQSPAYKKAMEPFAQRVAQELEDFRGWMAEHKPGDALKEANRRIQTLTKEFQDRMAELRRKCEQEAPQRKPACTRLYTAITNALIAISNRIQQLLDPTLAPQLSRGEVLEFLLTAMSVLIFAMAEWGRCMQCPALELFFT